MLISQSKPTFTLPAWIEPFTNPANRFCIAVGGRGSGKSYNIAQLLVHLSLKEKVIILCCREFHKSIRDSVYTLIKHVVNNLGLNEFFHFTNNEISTTNGSVFKFVGLWTNIESIKSIFGIKYCWIEEAETLSRTSWEILKPTIREDNSQFFISYNPRKKEDCIHDDFILNTPPKNAYVCWVNWRENPYFNQVLEDERLDCLSKDLGLYNHIWEGHLLEHSDAQIFKNCWTIQEFEEHENVIKYYGLDFGYSQDPTAAVECYIHEGTLYIIREAGKIKLDLDHIGAYIEARIPGFKKATIYADSADPGIIALLRKQGYNAIAAEKKKGSIENGIAHIRSMPVVIHPRCVQTAREMMLYSYLVDEKTDKVTDKIIDEHNHFIDALRYALAVCMYKVRADYSVLANKYMHLM